MTKIIRALRKKPTRRCDLCSRMAVGGLRFCLSHRDAKANEAEDVGAVDKPLMKLRGRQAERRERKIDTRSN